MKLAILSPTFPPKICGVGDHTFHLVNALRQAGHIVTVFSEQKDIDKTLNIQNTESLAEKIEQFSPDVLLFQYTPYLYGGKFNVGPYLWPVLRFAREKKIKIVMLAHELYFPIQFSLVGILVAPFQKWRFNKLRKFADFTVFTNELCWEMFKSSGKAGWLPVASNIPIYGGETALSVVSTFGIEEKEFLIVHFGGAHPTHLYDFVLAIPNYLHKLNFEKIKIVCIGITAEELEKWNSNRNESFQKIICVGRLPSNEISLWLKRANLVVAPFLDGISARRGSVMAAFEHGKCVVTTKGHSTEKSIPWSQFCAVTETDAKSFSREVAALIRDPEKSQKLGTAARDYYFQQIHWPVLSERLVDMISK